MNLKPLLAAGIIAATPFAASAATLIDDFTIFQTVTDIKESLTDDFEAAPDIVDPGDPYEWNRRQLRANLVSGENCIGDGPDEKCQAVTAVIGDGQFIYDSDSGTESWVAVRYQYDEYNLSASGNAFAFVFDGVEADQEFGLRITLKDSETGESREWFTEGPLGEDSTIEVLFADILGDGNEAMLDSISEINFRFSTENTDARALDLEISSITTAIPLPAGVLLMGTALAGFGVMRRRQKKAAA